MTPNHLIWKLLEYRLLPKLRCYLRDQYQLVTETHRGCEQTQGGQEQTHRGCEQNRGEVHQGPTLCPHRQKHKGPRQTHYEQTRQDIAQTLCECLYSAECDDAEASQDVKDMLQGKSSVSRAGFEQGGIGCQPGDTGLLRAVVPTSTTDDMFALLTLIFLSDQVLTLQPVAISASTAFPDQRNTCCNDVIVLLVRKR